MFWISEPLSADFWSRSGEKDWRRIVTQQLCSDPQPRPRQTLLPCRRAEPPSLYLLQLHVETGRSLLTMNAKLRNNYDVLVNPTPCRMEKHRTRGKSSNSVYTRRRVIPDSFRTIHLCGFLCVSNLSWTVLSLVSVCWRRIWASLGTKLRPKLFSSTNLTTLSDPSSDVWKTVAGGEETAALRPVWNMFTIVLFPTTVFLWKGFFVDFWETSVMMSSASSQCATIRLSRSVGVVIGPTSEQLCISHQEEEDCGSDRSSCLFRPSSQLKIFQLDCCHAGYPGQEESLKKRPRIVGTHQRCSTRKCGKRRREEHADR